MSTASAANSPERPSASPTSSPSASPSADAPVDSPVPSPQRDAAPALAVLAVVLGTVAAAALLPSAGKGGPPSTAAAFERDANCAEWGDGCVVCQRTPGGPACSTPGIACVRHEAQCLRRVGS